QFVVPDSLKLPQARLSLRRPGNPGSSEQYLISLSTTKPDLQFLPEGGQLVAGIKNQVAFKCVDQDGQELAVSGNLFDDKQHLITSFNTEYDGMGSIILVPKKGAHYSAKIEYEDSTFTYSLPDVDSETYGLHVIREDQDSIYFSIRQDSARVQDFILFGHTRGSTKFMAAGTLTTNELKLGIPKSYFPSGIAVFTLFVNRAPSSERLVYIDKNDPVQFEIYPDESSYGKRSLVNLDVLATDTAGNPLQGNFSFLAYDSGLDHSVDALENIRNYLLLSSDLNGQVLTNTDVFDHSDPNYKRKRDLLMLTNGWRRFSWTDIYQQSKPKTNYNIERSIVIDGEIRRMLTNKPVPKNFEVSMILRNKNAVHIDKTYTDEHGKFHFSLPFFTDSAELTIQTKNRLGAQRDYYISLHSNLENLEVDVTRFDKIQQSGISPLVVNLSAPKFIKENQSPTATSRLPKIKRPRIDNYYFPGKDTFMIQEVEVRSNFLNQRDSMISQSGQPDAVIESAQLKKLTEEKKWYHNIWDLISNQVPGLQIIQKPYEKRLEKYYNLVIANPDDRENMSEDSLGFGGPAVYFKVTNNPYGYLYIFVDRDFLNNSYVPLYDFLTYMDPSEIESINFVSKPKNYDISMMPGPELANNTLSFVNQTLGDDPNTEGSFDLQAMQDYLLKDFEKSTEPPAFLFITTKSKGGIFASRAKGIQSMYLSGLKAPREFYAPKYTKKNSKNTGNDYRKTIFWEPNLITDNTGFAHVSFYTNDSKNPINIQVGGVTKKGESGSKTFLLPREESSRVTPEPKLAIAKTTSSLNTENPYRKLRLYCGRISDKGTGQALAFANLTQNEPYYHETT
ncbi:MAG TPA: hypothetical protein VKA27_06690, partial [Sunxiuqinia sp.]|nr:hypothetical protein [Sunxiuqinia sp.]